MQTQGNITTISAAGYTATVLAGRDGDQVFVQDPSNHEIYAHRTNKGQGIERAWKVINENAPRAVERMAA